MNVRLLLLGSPAVLVGERSVALACERRTQLLAYLALRRTWVTRSELAALLWPDQLSRLAYTNLRKILFRLRVFKWAEERLEAQGSSLRFLVGTDVDAFDAALREQRDDDALALPGDELLAGFDDAGNDTWNAWLGFERDRLRGAWRAAALRKLTRCSRDDAANTDVPRIAARLLQENALDEDAACAVAAFHARAGQPGQARQVCHDYAQRLQRELGLQPGAAYATLLRSLDAPHEDGAAEAAGDRQTAGPARADEQTDVRSADGFIGRTLELRRIAELLDQADCRLLSLMGAGGIGKTRLALQVLQRLRAQYDAALFVSFEEVTDARDVPVQLAQAFGVGAKAARGDPMAAVQQAIGARRVLLVIDNFEQLSDAPAPLQQLLAACPALKLVVTSRVRLALPEEWLMPVEGLPCPEPEDCADIERFDAARLFIDTARRMRPDLDAAAEAPAIVEICQRVEGHPLALQLVAGWTRLLTCAEIADELRGEAMLLRTVDPSRPARHGSIEAVFDQCWHLIGDHERTALAQLTVFHGGFTADAAQAVTGALLPVLGALADKSLLRREGPRLTMHPLVHKFAGLRLPLQAAPVTRAAHAAYFVRQLTQRAEACERADAAALRYIDEEFDNCRHAWMHLLQSTEVADADRLVAFASVLVDYAEHRARFNDVLELVRTALAAPAPRRDAVLHSQLLTCSAWLQCRLGRYAESAAVAREVLAGAALRDPAVAYRAHSVVAASALFTGETSTASAHFRRALALARAAHRPFDVAAMLENLSLAERRRGRYAESINLLMEAMAQHRRNSDEGSLALCLSNLGSMQLFLGELVAGEANLSEALSLSERLGLVSTRAYVLANLTELAIKRRDVAAVRANARTALEIAEAHGMQSLAGWLKLQLARVSAWHGELVEAQIMLTQGSQLALNLGAPALKAAALLGLAELLEAHGEAQGAWRVLALAKDDAAISAPDRAELLAEWQKRASPQTPVRRQRRRGAAMTTASLSLDELLQRVVLEGPVNYGPLLATLQSVH